MQAQPAKRGLRAEELIGTPGPLTLVTNCVMPWNTQRLQREVDREAERTPHRDIQLPRYLPVPRRSLCRAATPNSGLSECPDAAQR